MISTRSFHLIITVLLMVISGLLVYVFVTPTATAPTTNLPTSPDTIVSPEPTTSTPLPPIIPDESSATEVTAFSFEATQWNWRGTNGPGRSVLSVVPAQNPFVLSFIDDARVSSATDCNSMSGSYAASNTELTFGPFAMTKMFCENSLEGEYAQQLSQVVRYTIDDTTLYLHLDEDAGTMLFTRVD